MFWCHSGSCDWDSKGNVEHIHSMFLGVEYFLLCVFYIKYSTGLKNVIQISHAQPILDFKIGHIDSPLRHIPVLGANPMSFLTTWSFIIFTFLVFFSRCTYYFLSSFDIWNMDIVITYGFKVLSPSCFVSLFMWELLPTGALLYFFKRIPPTDFCCPLFGVWVGSETHFHSSYDEFDRGPGQSYSPEAFHSSPEIRNNSPRTLTEFRTQRNSQEQALNRLLQQRTSISDITVNV